MTARMIRCKCGHETWTEQTAAVGHVANCRCCMKAWPSPLTSEKRCVACGFSLSRPHPHTDPRCSPSLLREAEVRLEALNDAAIAANKTFQERGHTEGCNAAVLGVLALGSKARAEVERLKNG